MAQYARPTSDITTTNWNCSTGSSYYALVDEAVADDADYVYVTPPSVGTLELKFGNTIASPGAGSSYIVLRYKGTAIAPNALATVYFVEGTTILGSATIPGSPTFVTTAIDVTAFPPSGYSNLRCRIVSGPAGTNIQVSQMYLQAPDAGSSGSFTLSDVGLGTLGQREFDYPTDNIGGPVRREDMFLTYSDADYTLLPRYCKAIDGRDAQAGFICALSGLWAPGHKLAYDDLGRPVISDYLSPANNPMPRFSRQ